MPTAFSDREREAIRARLLGAALDALRAGGLAGASVSSLARAASIAKGSFYTFYGSKEELFMEALESLEDAYRERFAAAAAGPGSPAERLERAFTAAFGLFDAEPALARLDGALVERLARALPPERVERHQAGDAEAVARLAAAWRADGLLAASATDAELAGAGYAVFLVAVGARALPDALRDATRRLAARGLAAALAASEAPEGEHGRSGGRAGKGRRS